MDNTTITKEMIENNLTTELSQNNINFLPKIKLIGVGGAGGNMLNYIAKNQLTNGNTKIIELIAANTDLQSLNHSKAHHNIQLGKISSNGLGAGMQPALGKAAAEESIKEIEEILNDTEILFISGGLGGGTGTGAIPVIAKIAKEKGILTVAVVTKPFSFEGSKRKMLANESLHQIENIVDSLIVIQNDKLINLDDNKTLGFKTAFSMVDEILASAVYSLTNIIVDNSENNINLDFADVSTIMRHKGKSLMAIGKGTNCKNAIENAINSPLLENFNIDGARGILVNFKVHPNISILEISQGMDLITKRIDPNADIIFGTIYEENLKENETQVTIVATGFNNEYNSLNPLNSHSILGKVDNVLNHNKNEDNNSYVNQSQPLENKNIYPNKIPSFLKNS
jgi:cell division protein FtsZ